LKVSLSSDTRTVSWSDCGVAQCTYGVEIVSPVVKPPTPHIFNNLKSLSYTLPSFYDNANYRYTVGASNQCGGAEDNGHGCKPHLAAPVFTQSCPMKASF
jgi:hypothetical protein